MSKKDYRMYENLIYVSQIGISMVIPIFAGVYIGNYLDEKFSTGGIFLLIFIILGVGTSFLNLYKLAMKKSSDKRRK